MDGSHIATIFLSWIDRHKTIVIKVDVDDTWTVIRRDLVGSTTPLSKYTESSMHKTSKEILALIPETAIHIAPRDHSEFQNILSIPLPFLLSDVLTQKYPDKPDTPDIVP